MGKRAGLIINGFHFQALSAFDPEHEGGLKQDALDRLLAAGLRARGDDPYILKYLFGTEHYAGLLRHYRSADWDVDVWEEDYFKARADRLGQAYGHFDFQFASRIPESLVMSLWAGRKTVIGWCPAFLGSKHLQARLLANTPATRAYVPRQIHATRPEQLSTATPQAIQDFFPGDYLIVKPFYSSRSKMPDGQDYAVLATSSWAAFARYIQLQSAWFVSPHGVIVSELILTQDPYLAGQNHVGHKVHIPTGVPDRIWAPWPLTCHKIPATLHLDRIGGGIQPLGDIVDWGVWRGGDVESCRLAVKSIADVFFPLPCLFSLDLMIRPDGRLYFLEINKIAGTFLDPLGREGRCPLEEYMNYALSASLSGSLQKTKYLDYKRCNDFYSLTDTNWQGPA